MADAPPSRSSLVSLPLDALVSILCHLSAEEVFPAALCCRSLHAAAVTDDLWRHRLERDFEVVIARIFAGACPPPTPSVSFRTHYFGFPASWMYHARHIGRVILEIDGIIYDVTKYVHQHPGEAELLLAAAGTDASEVFASIGHTANARKILGRFAVAPSHQLVPLRTSCKHRPPAASSAIRTAVRTVLTDLRSKEGRGRLGELARTVVAALVHDLTEGRPDCRRYSPAVLRLAASRLCLP